MQRERLSRPQSQETCIINPNALAERAIIEMLRDLSVPITITPQVRERDGRRFYTYQVGETTEERPFGMHTGAQWQFLDAVRVSLEAAIQPRKGET